MMAIERRPIGQNRHYVVTTECSLCGEPIPEGQAFAKHLRYNCEANAPSLTEAAQ